MEREMARDRRWKESDEQSKLERLGERKKVGRNKER